MTTTVELPGNYWGSITLGVLDERERETASLWGSATRSL
jgi:hypothetical protein